MWGRPLFWKGRRNPGTNALSLGAEKHAARERALAARAGAHRAADPAHGESLWANLQAVVSQAEPGWVVSGYWSMRNEVDLGPVLERLVAAGFDCALPVVQGRSKPLVFRRWRPGDALAEAPFGLREPLDTATEVSPRILLVPLLAFDRMGRRLGYGGGYYDRTLSGLRSGGAATAVGIAFAAQELAEVPAGPGDERLDWIVTEREAIRADWN